MNDNHDLEMELILQNMIEENITISARGVARIHSKINAASSITRIKHRRALFDKYKLKQNNLRVWAKRLDKQSHTSTLERIAEQELIINKLEHKIELLTASHVAMIRVVGELGGFSKWVQFFQDYHSSLETLYSIGAVPDDIDNN